jgi:uncharacterized protein YndB with AHSA1/START domain
VTDDALVTAPQPPTLYTVHVTRDVSAPPYRVFRAWSSPEALAEWFPDSVEGSLATSTRSTLVFPATRVWWDVVEAEPPTKFRFRWSWLADDAWITTATVTISPRGPGSHIVVDDGPFDLSRPELITAFADCNWGWGEALANLSAVLDYSVDLRRTR